MFGNSAGFCVIIIVLLTLDLLTKSHNTSASDEITNFGNCRTPNSEPALCVKLQHCPVFIELLKKIPLSPAERTFIGNSQCGYTNGTVLVCCPSPSTGTRSSQASTVLQFEKEDGLDEMTSYGNCKTPKGEAALCLKLQNCPVIAELLKKKPLSHEEVTFLRNSQCGYTNGTTLVCCSTPDSETHSFRSSTVNQYEVKTGRERIINYGNCTTVRNESAFLAKLDLCKALLKKFPLTPEDTALIQTNQCETILAVEENIALPEPGTCGDASSDRIFGGNITKIDEYPWMALIEYLKDGTEWGHHCGGSLINSRYVLTAAHCINIRENLKPVRVRLGEWNTATDRDCVEDTRGFKDCADPHIDIPIDKTVLHEDYNPNSMNKLHDIGLIRLSKSVAYTDFIRPICLPLNENIKRKNFEGNLMDVAGWGRIENGSMSDIKLKASIPILPLSRCKRFYQNYGIQIEETQICAGGELGIDSCRGDSGGPLVGLDTTNKMRVYRFIYGIVSYGTVRCGVRPGVYTKVHKYTDWIVVTMNKIESLIIS